MTNINVKDVKMFYGTVHAYKKHGYGEDKIRKALDKPILNILTDYRNGNMQIWNNDYEVVIVDKELRVITAFQSTLHYYMGKLRKAY